jgi:hypothetical protein
MTILTFAPTLIDQARAYVVENPDGERAVALLALAGLSLSGLSAIASLVLAVGARRRARAPARR